MQCTRCFGNRRTKFAIVLYSFCELKMKVINLVTYFRSTLCIYSYSICPLHSVKIIVTIKYNDLKNLLTIVRIV